MFKKIKSLLYFPLAYYFRFFAQIQLLIWKPRVIVVTGSSGKTTLLHLIESQLGDKAVYSHKANSAFGVPFDILNLRRKSLELSEWPALILTAPFRAFIKPKDQKIYIVEADCDRPQEGQFLGSLLKPEVTIWLSSSRTHSMNFDGLVSPDSIGVKQKHFQTVEDAIAYEFGYFLENTSSLVVVNGDLEVINKQLNRTKAKVKVVKANELKEYKLTKKGTEFRITEAEYELNALLPKETFYSIQAVSHLMKYFKHELDPAFSKLELAPGRSSVFKGIKNTTIIDSSYNNSLDGAGSMLSLLKSYPSDQKWAILGDILEQGSLEKEEHERLAELIADSRPDRIILIGPRVSEYTYPKLVSLMPKAKIEKFLMPKEVLEYLEANLKGGEVILFKGARFLEGVIEHLLQDKKDIEKLCRREKVWQIRREKFGIPSIK